MRLKCQQRILRDLIHEARPMLKAVSIVVWLAFMAPAFSYGQASSSQQQAFFNTYCMACHNEKLRTAGLSLEKLDAAHVADNAEQWEKVVRKLRSTEMPPPGRSRPDPASYDSVASFLEGELD